MLTSGFDALKTDTVGSRHARPGILGRFAADVRDGLSQPQRELPSRYLYDEIGTALYETITLLPEYGLNRAEERLLRRYAPSILKHLPSSLMVAELGSGSGRKTRWLLEALARRDRITYYPIDISASALRKCRQELAELGSVSLVGLENSYVEGLRDVASRRPSGQTLLVLFLGSTIGNFNRPVAQEFLREIRRSLQPGDALLLGTDLEKSEEDLILAYDDPLGVTAAFNMNILARINGELGGNFALRQFSHEVRYDRMERRIEMHLRSARDQTVSIREADWIGGFRRGETIWTEACHKFNTAELRDMAHQTGYVCIEQWVDGGWPFAENLWIAAPVP